MDSDFVCECVATCSHACLNSQWEANMTELRILCAYTKKGLCIANVFYVLMCACVCWACLCDPAVATKCLMCWDSSPFDKLSPGFSCSPASLCWTQCEGTGPPASPLSPRWPANTNTKTCAVNIWSCFVLALDLLTHYCCFYQSYIFKVPV